MRMCGGVSQQGHGWDCSTLGDSSAHWKRGCPWARGVLQMTCEVDCEVQPLDGFDYTLGFVSVFLLDFD